MRRWQTTRGGASEIGPWSCPMLARRGLRGGGWGNAWPTEVAEGWLPGPTIIVGQRFGRSQLALQVRLAGLLERLAADDHDGGGTVGGSQARDARAGDDHVAHGRRVFGRGRWRLGGGPGVRRLGAREDRERRGADLQLH